MTVTLELTPEIEAKLQARAQAQGLPVKAYLQGVIEQLVMPEAPPTKGSLTAEERAAQVRAIKGKYAHIGASSEEFMRRKLEDIDHEERLLR